jgi:succinate dehydrogenase/fumarate reductase flavoprotein subunit
VDYARQIGLAAKPRPVGGAGGAALRSRGQRSFDPAQAIAGVQAEVFPYDKNYFRKGDVLDESLQRLDRLWGYVRESDAAPPENQVQAREAAAMVATARWMYRSAAARHETRGMHKREDHPGIDVNQRHYLACGGLDEVWVSPRSAAVRQTEEVAA